MAIEKISENKRKQIINKSVNPLPNNPSKAGYKADEIKKAMFGFVTDEKDSIIAEINRIINEINFNFDNIDLSDYNTKEEIRNLIKDFITNNTSELENYYTKKQIEESLATNADLSKKYTDERVAGLINSAPETLDTFKEIADAFAEDQEVLDALNSAIGLKAGKSDLEATNTRVTSLEGSVATLESDKVDKVDGKGLSTNDLTDDLLGKINNNTVIEITESSVHIKDLGSGIYKLPMGCTFSFYATNKFTAPSESYLFVTETNEGRREFYILCSDYYAQTGIGNKYLISGYAYIPSAVGYSYKFVINKNYVDTSTDQSEIYGNKTFKRPVKMTEELSQNVIDDDTLVTAKWTKDKLDTKQDKLDAGTGITIEGNRISASLGDGAQITKLPSPVHIYNLDSGVYQLPAGCELYYNNSYASGEEHYYRINYVNESETILFVQTTEYYATQKSDRKLFVLFAENDSYGKRGSEGSFIVGVATATGGSNHIAGIDTSIYIPREGDALVYGTKTFQDPTKYSSALSLATSLNDRTLVDAQWVNAVLAGKGYLTSIPSEYVTETELNNKGYLTSIPSEYVTETELANKNYATKSEIPDASAFVTTNTAQTITGKKTFSGNGLAVSGRPIGSGDDEGIVVSPAPNNYAGICLGNPNGKRTVLYLHSNGTSVWRFNNGSTSYDLTHPAKSGTVATTGDIPHLYQHIVYLTGGNTRLGFQIYTSSATEFTPSTLCSFIHNSGCTATSSADANWFPAMGGSSKQSVSFQGVSVPTSGSTTMYMSYVRDGYTFGSTSGDISGYSYKDNVTTIF